MDDRETARTRAWWQRFPHAVMAAGALAAVSQPLSAEHGFRFSLKKPSAAPAKATAPKPKNGFAASIQKLQADAKRRAFEGDLDGAIACAQRARKIAEASSAMLSEHPECTVEAADRLVEQLMAVKSTTRPPAAPATAVAAAPARPAGVPAAPARQFDTDQNVGVLTPPIPSWERPLTVFEPHPLPAVAQPPAVVAGGWNGPSSQPMVVYSSSDAGDGIDEIVQSDERTFALLLARASAKRTAAAPAAPSETSTTSAAAEEPWATTPAASEDTVTTAGATKADWLIDAEPQTTASNETDPPLETEPYLITVEHRPSAASSDDAGMFADLPTTNQPLGEAGMADDQGSLEVARVSANRAQLEEHQDGSAVATAGLSSESEPSTEVTATTYRTTSDVGSLTATAEVPVNPDIGLTSPSVYVRDVEPPTPATATRARPSAPHLAERLARWLHVPITTVAAGLAGLGLILLGLGLSMARSALRSPTE